MIGGNRVYPRTVDDNSFLADFISRNPSDTQNKFLGQERLLRTQMVFLFYASAIFEANHIKGSYRKNLLSGRCSDKPKLLLGFEPENPCMEGRRQYATEV